MSEERSSSDPGEKSWIEKITHAFNQTPKSQQDLLALLHNAYEDDVIDNDVYKILDGAIKVGNMQVREIMIPRTQMEVIKADQPLNDALKTIIESSHSRYPVIGENADEILGILLAKDLLPQLLENSGGQFDVKALLRPATVVPESKRLNVLLREFRENRNHMAIVVDEYGGVAGLVTIEDVLEQIVGDIEDEHDDGPDTYIKKLAENDYIIKALTPIEDFNAQFNTDFSDEEFDTIGGIILQQLGHLPRRNETTEISGFAFKVVNADNRQVHLLRMTALPPAE